MENVGSWTKRWIIVCGGTSGLGLQLVIAAAQQRANLVIIGRDLERLEVAKQVAMANGADSAAGYSIDLSLKFDSRVLNPSKVLNPSEGQDQLIFQEWLSTHPVDLLINTIGRSDRGNLEQLSDMALASMINDNVICTWNMTRLALDSIKRARGTIVNIGSLAGVVGAPGMGGYSVSKSALTAMSRQLRLELASSGVHVMLVCPGPIAREDSGSRYQKIANERGLTDKAAHLPGGGVKLRLIDPTVLCKKILASAHLRQKELIYPSKAKWLAAVANLWPNLADWILKKYLRS